MIGLTVATIIGSREHDVSILDYRPMSIARTLQPFSVKHHLAGSRVISFDRDVIGDQEDQRSHPC